MDNHPPRICFVTYEYPPIIGGVAKSAARIVKYLVQEGFDVHVIVPVNYKPLDTVPFPSLENGASIYRVPRKSSAFETAFAINHIIQNVDNVSPFDIFHGFFLPMAYPFLSIVEKTKRPIIASIRGNDAVTWLEDSVRPQIIRTVIKNATWITSVCTDLLDRVAALEDVSERSSVILNAIDTTGFPKWKITDANFGTVGTVAEFRKKKAIPLLIESYANINPVLRQQLLLVGYFSEENERTKSAELIRQNRLEAEVRLTGKLLLPSVLEYLLSMRVFVQCSSHDGLPNALLEAAAVGVPLVATDVGGMRDVLKDGESAILIPPGNRRRLTDAIELVLRDEDLAKRLSHGALKVAENLHPLHEKKAWIDLYYQLLHCFRGN